MELIGGMFLKFFWEPLSKEAISGDEEQLYLHSQPSEQILETFNKKLSVGLTHGASNHVMIQSSSPHH